ncbi:MAG: FAD-binding protein, partial [Muribaculaceae bacterium]|nr:FAD-binding protein [Muribaculaceae bacterium]
MLQEITLQTDPRTSTEEKAIKNKLAEKLHLSPEEINDFRVFRRSVDARGNKVRVNLSVKVATGEDKKVSAIHTPRIFWPVDENAPTMVIVGAGPAGLFAALKCIECGIRPIVLERGRDVDTRRIDIAAISRCKQINPESNYCYGEGGAGAFSDGKLFTRSKKRGSNEDVLQLLVQFGASEDILIDAHPHIGSDRLPTIIKRIRETIIENGGEVLFEKKVEKLLLEDNKAIGVIDSSGVKYYGSVMLANGHSARDFIKNLHAQGVKMEAKGIAIGVRLEHPQQLIDRIQYHQPEGRGKYLPAAEYSFVAQSNGRGVYSFCMC